jgi:hypothetical protein
MANEYAKAAQELARIAHHLGVEEQLLDRLKRQHINFSLGILPLAGTVRGYFFRLSDTPLPGLSTAPVASARLISAGFVASTGGVSDANDFRTITLESNDMAGGADTLLDTKGGASTTVAAQTYIPFTVAPATDVLSVVGRGFFVESTAAMSGEAWGLTTVHAVVELD